MASNPLSSCVFEEATEDLFSNSSRHFVVYADRLSGWKNICAWNKSPSIEEVVRGVAKNKALLI